MITKKSLLWNIDYIRMTNFWNLLLRYSCKCYQCLNNWRIQLLWLLEILKFCKKSSCILSILWLLINFWPQINLCLKICIIDGLYSVFDILILSKAYFMGTILLANGNLKYIHWLVGTFEVYRRFVMGCHTAVRLWWGGWGWGLTPRS